MCCLTWFQKKNSYEDLKRQSKQKTYKLEKFRRSKVRMRRLIKGNSPIIWFVGPPGVGRKVLGKSIADAFEYTYFDVAELLGAEALKQTSRGRSVAWILMKNRRLPMLLVLDILKEAMAEEAEICNDPPAWLVNGFPLHLEEAFRFEAEVGRVGLLLYLTGDVQTMAQMIKERYSENEESFPRNITQRLSSYIEHLNPVLRLYSDRLERVDVSEELLDVYQELYQIVVSFEMTKPSNNKPSTATFDKLRRYQREHPFFEGGHLSSRGLWRLAEKGNYTSTDFPQHFSTAIMMESSDFLSSDTTPPLQRLSVSFSRPSTSKDRVPGL